MEVPLGDTYYLKFTSRAFATGIPTTLAGTPALSVYEENNLTQITAGITLTADYDTVTGLNDVAIVASSGNGYEVGKYYNVVITTGTVDSVSVVGEVVGHFRIVPAEDAGAGIRDVNITHVGDSAQDLPTATALATVDSNVDAILVDTGTTLDTKLNDIQGATFSSATDSLEAIRNRGDSAWTGSPTTSDSGTAQAGSASSITLAAGAPSIDLSGQVVFISAGTGAGQSRAISSYDTGTKVATVIRNWGTSPDNTSVYEVYPDDITEISAAPTAADVADAVWDESTAGHTTAGTFGEQCKNDIDAILADTDELQSDWTNGGRLDLIIDAILVDTGEIGTAGAGLTDLASAADLATLDAVADAILVDTGTTLPGLIGTPVADLATDIATMDTVVDAIKAKTDSLTFTGSFVQADMQAADGAAISQGGSAPASPIGIT